MNNIKMGFLAPLGQDNSGSKLQEMAGDYLR